MYEIDFPRCNVFLHMTPQRMRYLEELLALLKKYYYSMVSGLPQEIFCAFRIKLQSLK